MYEYIWHWSILYNISLQHKSRITISRHSCYETGYVTQLCLPMRSSTILLYQTDFNCSH